MTATTVPVPTATPTDPATQGRRRPWLGWLKHPLVLAVALLMVAPFIWMLLTSFKGLPQLLQDPLSVLPNPWVWTNFADAWNALPFGRAIVANGSALARDKKILRPFAA